MVIIKFNRINKHTQNDNHIPWNIVDALDELFNRFEWCFKELIFEGDYVENSSFNGFNIYSIMDETGHYISTEDIRYAYSILHPTFQTLISIELTHD